MHRENDGVEARIAEATTVIEYLVDGQGRRVGKTVNGVFEKGWLWRGQLQPVAELDASGNVAKRFVYGGGVNAPELMVTSAGTYRLVKDHLGSVRFVIDVSTGAVVQELAYDAWGRVVLDTNPDFQPFGFAGGLYEAETGLVRFGARDYDAEVGRWTAKDLARFGGGVNFMRYADSDPMNLKDPRGFDSRDGEEGSGPEGGDDYSEPDDVDLLCLLYPFICMGEPPDDGGMCEPIEPEYRNPPSPAPPPPWDPLDDCGKRSTWQNCATCCRLGCMNYANPLSCADACRHRHCEGKP